MRPPARDVIRRFQRSLLAWYGRHGRDLPWRRTRHPYRVLVSEIMLQQTQVDRVVPKYREFLRRYPTLGSLAAARVDDVRRLWYPLGYNIRPVRLHAIARETVARYGGRLPDRAERLRSLPGVGRCTAGAILSFAYGQDAAVLDTNVRRVLGRGYDFNQALMDFGAICCTPRGPKCPPCPMKAFCATRAPLRRGRNGRGTAS